MTWPAFSGQFLQEGTDYWFIDAGAAVDASVDSVLVTRAAFDQILNELQFEREKRQAAEVALTACRSLVEERATLAEMLENSKQQWWIPILSAGAAGLGGYIAGNQSCDSVTFVGGGASGGPLQ